jgi:hypothetical protein
MHEESEDTKARGNRNPYIEDAYYDFLKSIKFKVLFKVDSIHITQALQFV